MKLLVLLVLLPAVAWPVCREGYIATDVEGVCQQKPIDKTNPAWVSDEKPPEEKLPSWQREGIVIIDAPNMEADDKKRMQEIKQADEEGKRRAGLKAKFR